MPPTLTYPGVYIAEAASGVHAITGVATSIGALDRMASCSPRRPALSTALMDRRFGCSQLAASAAMRGSSCSVPGWSNPTRWDQPRPRCRSRG